jgi:hypothetical protein
MGSAAAVSDHNFITVALEAHVFYGARVGVLAVETIGADCIRICGSTVCHTTQKQSVLMRHIKTKRPKQMVSCQSCCSLNRKRLIGLNRCWIAPWNLNRDGGVTR